MVRRLAASVVFVVAIVTVTTPASAVSVDVSGRYEGVAVIGSQQCGFTNEISGEVHLAAGDDVPLHVNFCFQEAGTTAIRSGTKVPA